jgi:hypothetical protein
VLKVEEESELIIGVFIEAIEKGDWRAAEPLLQRVYGRPQEKVEVSQPQSVGGDVSERGACSARRAWGIAAGFAASGVESPFTAGLRPCNAVYASPDP